MTEGKQFSATSVKLPKEMYRQLKEICKGNGMTQSEAIVYALAEKLNMPEFFGWKEEE